MKLAGSSGAGQELKSRFAMPVLRFCSGAVLLLAGLYGALLCFFQTFELPEGVLRGGIIFSYVFSCFLGGMVVSGKQEGKKYLWGLLAGILYYVILVAVSMILNREAFTRIPGVFPALFLCAFGGMLGGMTQAGRK